MSNEKNDKGNIYDRIFRENARYLFIPLIQHVYQLDIKSYVVLDPQFPSTSENEVDFLYELNLTDGTEQILHIEFQSANDPQMLERMQEYHAKIYKKYKKPIKPLVINLGQHAFTARNKLSKDEIFYGYDILNLFDLSTDKLLSSQVPEVVVLAILSNYSKNQLEAVLSSIVKNLKQLVKTEKDMNRLVNQLFFLSRLRKFEKETKQTLDKLTTGVKIETDFYYQQGVEIGTEKGIEIGTEKGIEIGTEKGLALGIKVIELHKKGDTPNSIAKKLNIKLQKVKMILKAFKDSK